MELITLTDGTLRVDIDPGRGADILQIVDLASGMPLLASTPWRSRADAIRAGAMQPTAIDPTQRWMEQYRGGWQTLCPNAGAPRDLEGALVGFHGEASVAAWEIVAQTASTAMLRIELFSVPVTIDRELLVRDSTLQIRDVLTNSSARDVTIDYVSHPAFGGDFLDGECLVTTGAARFDSDPDSGVAPLDLRRVPAPPDAAWSFGWLSDFSTGWASIVNPQAGLGVRLDWDARILPFAWWWQELNASEGPPWFRRARIMAIEPASTVTSGDARAHSLTIPAGAQVLIPISLTVTKGRNVDV